MASGYGTRRQRFERHILERTADHPSVVPMIMEEGDKVSFRLACKDTLRNSNFTSWFDEASLYGGPGMLKLDHAIVVCLGECLEQGAPH